jgi:hypothetical protein
MYYKRFELQKRLVFFFSSSLVAGAFGGLLAFALVKMNKLGGYAGWRWYDFRAPQVFQLLTKNQDLYH